MNLKELLRAVDKAAAGDATRRSDASTRLRAIKQAASGRSGSRSTAKAVWLVWSAQECRGCGATYPSVSPELFTEFECPRGLNWKRATPKALLNPSLPRRMLKHPPHTIDACPACFAGEGDPRQLELAFG